jgi:type II secretory pathway component PulJ
MSAPAAITGQPAVARVARGAASAGFSLIELLIAVAFLALFTVTVQQFCRTVLRGVRVLEAASEAQEAARLAVQLIAADLREAGYSPDGDRGNGLRLAERNAVQLERDLNGDGDADDSTERVGYHYDGDRQALLRSQGSAPPQPLLDALAADGLRLTYAGSDGVEVGAGAGLDAAARARVRRIGVRVVIAVPHPDPAYGGTIRVEQDGVVSLRNGGS